ncbi:zein-binding domain-containing protein [Artemisia annua]|uniref:Zein-binding domain-containing protein n=1 Tax=Artemisia annua TaxID=35608 RepID=A0A2U1L4H6_ARTAN|nr:zein-binding domain-containing protein [Artemisia annua]
MNEITCSQHVVEFLNLYDSSYNKKVTRDQKCSCRSMDIKAISVDKALDSALKIKSDYKEDEIEEVHIPVENKSGHIQVFDQIIPLEWTDSSTSCCSTSSSLNGDDDQVEKQACKDVDHKEDKDVTINSLMAQLKAERLVVCGLYIELDEERNVSAIAANQAMVMITKLQEEKEVLKLLNELVMKLESDIIELENELEMYKEKFLDYKGKEKEKVMPQCPVGSCSTNKESLDDASLSDFENLRKLEESIAEYGVEKLWILDEILTKGLNENLVGKSSSKGENLDFHSFDIKGIDEEAEASHSPLDDASLSDFENLRKLEESIAEYGVEKLWILDEILTKGLNENLVGKSSSKGENLDFHSFDIKGIDEEAEASHSPWSLSSF